MRNDGTSPATILRRLVMIGGRKIHMRHAGSGPHLLLIHGSPASSEYLLPLIGQLAPHYSCLAVDTPGFGGSDPLPLESRSIPDVAAATAELLDTLQFGPCLVMGTHTGAAVALELALQRPELVGGLVLDGVALFDSAEQPLFAGYFEPVAIDDRGGHYARTWTRIRDMFIWFPWTSHAPDRLNGVDLPPVTTTHRWVSMLFQAAPHYAEVYAAAIAYAERAFMAAAVQTRPAIYLAHERDMLAPHLSRLPALKPLDRIELTSSAPGQWSAAVERALAELERTNTIAAGSLGPPPAAGGDDETPDDRFVDMPHGQVRLRRFGCPESAPLLMLHDAPGSGVMLRGLAQAMTDAWCVWVPDIPGCGSSMPLDPSAPTLADYAASLDRLMASISLEPMAVYGRGCGAAVALALARQYPARCRRLVLDELLLTDGGTAPPASRFLPRITLDADGSHWFRTWQMLRDSQIFWPWYDTSAHSLLRLPGDFSGEFLHAWTAQVLEQYATAHCLPWAALECDARAELPSVRAPLTLMARRGHPLAGYAKQLRDTMPQIGFAAYEEEERAGELHRLLDSIDT